MAEKINLKEMENKAYRIYCVEDGLFDIFLGLIFVTGAIRSLTDNVLFTLGVAVAVIFYMLAKKYITNPRIGRVKFGRFGGSRQFNIMLVLLVSITATVALLSLSLSGLGPAGTFAFPFVAVLLVVVFSALAYFLCFKRLYAYGLMFGVSEVIWNTYGVPLGPMANLVTGSIIMTIGLVYLHRFLRKYPKP